jgi:hypothetical protein
MPFDLSRSAARVASAYEKRAWDVVPGFRSLPRSTYLPPELRDSPPNVDPEGTDLAIWKWESGGRPMAIAFQANGNKPLFYHSFSNDGQRQRTIDGAIKARKEALAYKQKRQEERRNFRHSIQPGEIYYTSWGYDQTNVDFFEVVAVAEKSISVRPISSKVVKSERGADYVAAIPGKYVGPPVTKVPNVNGFSIDGHYASKWDGKPKYQTAAGWGH